MSAQDPLSEAREALREISDLIAPEDADVDDVQAAFNRCELALARLDALPAPKRRPRQRYWDDGIEAPSGWFYPDAPVTDDAAPGQQPREVTCPYGVAECPCNDGDPCNYESLPGSPAMQPPVAREDGGEDAD